MQVQRIVSRISLRESAEGTLLRKLFTGWVQRHSRNPDRRFRVLRQVSKEEHGSTWRYKPVVSSIRLVQLAGITNQREEVCIFCRKLCRHRTHTTDSLPPSQGERWRCRGRYGRSRGGVRVLGGTGTSWTLTTPTAGTADRMPEIVVLSRDAGPPSARNGPRRTRTSNRSTTATCSDLHTTLDRDGEGEG